METGFPPDFYSSKTYTDKTISFHEEEENKRNPFFCYLAFQAIHAPVQALKEFVEPYKETYAEGWNILPQKRFERAGNPGFFPTALD